MPAIKLQKFLGTAPKISSELLPDGAGQIAYNVQLYSGDLLPYPEPYVVDAVPLPGVIQTLFGMRDPDTDLLSWLVWANDVDIVTATDSSDNEQRFYYTGDGGPKVSTFALATTGSEPYPVSAYDLGLPLPTTELTATAVSFTSPTSASYERDSGNTAIITTAAAHGLRTGNIVTVRGFTGAVPETFNVTNTRITVTSSTTFEYYSSGAVAAEAADTNGIIDLAGSTVTRDYTYTWTTPWLEESVGADPSDTLFMKDGQTSIITGLPTAAPAGDNFITGVNVYRTLTGAGGTEFYKLASLFFPLATTLVERTSSVASVTVAKPHGVVVGDRFKLAGCTTADFDVTDGIVTVVGSTTQFSYANAFGDVGSTADTTGVLYRDAAELIGNTSRYWGDDSITTTLRERTSNVATLTTASAHGLVSNQVVAIANMGDSDYDDAAAVVTVTGATTFTYPNTAGNEASTADTAGTITSDSFVDDFDSLNLVDLLLTDDYDPPNASMSGLTEVQNNMLAGFFGNQLCFAEPKKPWAWPLAYRRTFEHDIVAIEAVAGYLIVLTGVYAYRVSGSDPATLNIARVDTPYPCLSKKSVVNMGYGVLFATYGGLALWSPAGLTLATKYLHDWDTWDDNIDPSTLVGTFFKDKYFGSYSTGSFLFERDEKVGGYYTDAGFTFNSAWVDPSDNALYTSSDELGSITQWGSPLYPLRAMEWKSKVIVSKDYLNIGAARVIADYTATAEDIAAYNLFNDAVATNNAAVWTTSQQLATVNGPTDYVASSVTHYNFAELNRVVIHGDSLLQNTRTVPSTYSLTFNLWQNKTLVFTRVVTDSGIFRCPAGYKSDTFEVSVSSVARVRAIHMAETPDGLRNV